MKKYFFALSTLLMVVALEACKTDKFDGLLNLDPLPENAITFPDAVNSAGQVFIDQNAFIIPTNSIAQGNLAIRIRVPDGRQIQNVRGLVGQLNRFNATFSRMQEVFLTTGVVLLSPPVSITIPVATPPITVTRVPANTAFVRYNPVTNNTTVWNYGQNITVEGSGSSLVTLRLPFSSLPTGALGLPQAGDVFRFFITLQMADGSLAQSMEVRAVMTP